MRSKGEGASPSWEKYVAQLNIRFGSDLHHDPIAKLRNPRQTCSVHGYLIKFEELLNRVDLTEDYILSFFLSGLKEEMQDTIRLLKPTSLQQAISLTKL